MLITLDNSSQTPFYQQIVEQIRRKIITGQLGPGVPLPSIRQLAADLTTSVITTKRAYQDLEKEGIIQTRPGRGTFVSDLGDNCLRQMGLEEVESKLREALSAASQLGVPRAAVEGLIKKALESEELESRDDRDAVRRKEGLR